MDFSPERVLRETGAGAPRGDTIRNAPPADSSSAVPPSSPPPAAGVPAWAAGAVSAKGTGVPTPGETGAAARIGAERSAELDARRRLLEKVQGVQIDAQTTMRDFITQNDQVRSRVLGVLQGAEVGEPKLLSDGSVEVVVSLPMEKVYHALQGGEAQPGIVRALPAQ
ncbi:MAG: LPP20 family lipoprotein [Verrucomicrobia bacterium]|nr:LPP20 family lipoprotein [Verrucomicrobiota bacterium]